MREHNQEADRLANDAMDKGMGRSVARVGTEPVTAPAAKASIQQQEFEGIVRQGKVELLNGTLPEGTKVQLRVKK